MKKIVMLLSIGASVVLANSAQADKPAKADKGTKPAKMTCEDFLSFDVVSRPKLVYWAEGFNGKGKADDAVFDVESTDRLIPVITEVCQKEPKASFWKKVKEEFKKIF